MSDSLRNRFLQELTARGYAQATLDAYLSNVSLMVKRLDRHPATLTDRDVTVYLASLLSEHKVAPNTYRQHLGAIKLFFSTVLHRELPILQDARPPKQRKLPTVLTEKETHGVLRHIRMPRHRMAATVAYACGLRRMEVMTMMPSWIEAEGTQLHVQGKRGKERLVPLPPRVLELLREYWLKDKLPGPFMVIAGISPPFCFYWPLVQVRNPVFLTRRSGKSSFRMLS